MEQACSLLVAACPQAAGVESGGTKENSMKIKIYRQSAESQDKLR